MFLKKYNNGFGIFGYLNPAEIPTDEKDEYIEISQNDFDDLSNKKKMWLNGELVYNPNYVVETAKIEKRKAIKNIKSQISHYKSLLAQTDYRAIKYSEGLYTEKEYAPYKYQRQSYRDEINRLEKELEKYNI